MRSKYLKRFALTNELLSIEKLRDIAQMQARMEGLVNYGSIQYLSDGYYFSMEEIGDKEISYSDIMWAEGVNAEHSILHMKNGETIALPFGARGLDLIFYDSKIHFLKITRNVFITASMIEKVSRRVVYLKGCDIPFKVSANCVSELSSYLYDHLTIGIETWTVPDYIRWKTGQQQI